MFQSIRDTLPQSRILRGLLAVIVVSLLLAPFIFDGSRALDTAARLCIFIVLVASYDLLLGYTGVVSFAHTLFFGIGAYSVAIAFDHVAPGFGVLLVAVVVALGVSTVVAVTIGLVSLRVKAIFYAMITLAVASVATVLVSQLYLYTGGEDGMTYRIPRVLTPAFKLLDDKVLGVRINGKLLNYYLIFTVSTVLFLLMVRIVASPFGKVLKALRENDFRAEAIGYTTVYYRTAATVISACMATLAGVLMAIWLRYTGPDSVLSLNIMIDILLMVVIGGMGSLYGAIIGATLLVLARNYLNEAMGVAHNAFIDVPILAELFNPERWLLWLGVLFVVMVYFFPLGIVGRLVRGRADHG
ncbi:branched-chain amino acid ABC transporter, permease protein [Reinekea blandensis MED297]|uniref:Branched-chain amino acid ABC transporter, permease protein n=2 Tax=Reinekea TaxID=230494 RepID=A4BDV2_9GAMM|nr:branched-chain amino acid ABC transporter, permease protein [Reinekea blandensis MED297]